MLAQAVPYSRATVALSPDDDALIGQYVGPRLPAGATELPTGARIDWFHVRLLSPAGPDCRVRPATPEAP